MPRSSPLRYSSRSDLEFANAVEQVRQDLLLLKACLAAMRVRLELKYSDMQPRWPAGDPRGGQWRPLEGGGDGSVGDPPEQGDASESDFGYGEAPDGTLIEPAGTSGFSRDEQQMTVQQFRSAYCNADIRAVLPGQFGPMTIAEVIMAAKGGDAAARKCLKLLGEKRFRK